MTKRLGIFAILGGWLLDDAGLQERFSSRDDALGAARRRAGLTRWRGEKAEVLAQETAGGPLSVVDPPAPGGATRGR